jgi:predicted dehydrogenase
MASHIELGRSLLSAYGGALVSVCQAGLSVLSRSRGLAGNVRVGLVGASAGGGWGSVAHVPDLRAAAGIELAAVCTSRPDSAAAASDVFGVPGFHAVRDLAAQDDIDLVSVVVRVPRHRDVVMAALDGAL